MRIISGTWRGQGLKVPPGARATTDRVREAIFSILDEAGQKDILDLYAGSGALGIEALSRGARSACFVDISHYAISAIHHNLAGKQTGTVTAIRSDALHFLRKSQNVYHWIFCDPPYDRVDYRKLLSSLAESSVMESHSLLVLESDRYHTIVIPSELELTDQRKFGDTVIYFLQRRENDSSDLERTCA
jgi:16S rRNA (guanine966-N2)-methyltransferase